MSDFPAPCWNFSAVFPMTPLALPIWRRRAGRMASSARAAATARPGNWRRRPTLTSVPDATSKPR